MLSVKQTEAALFVSVNEYKSGERFLINADQVRVIAKSPVGCAYIFFAGYKKPLHVVQSVEELMNALEAKDA